MGDNYIEDWNFLVTQHSEFYSQPECKIQNLWESYFSEIFGFKKIFNKIDSQRKLHIGSMKNTFELHEPHRPATFNRCSCLRKALSVFLQSF